MLIEPLQWCHYIIKAGYITVGFIFLAHVIWLISARSVLARPSDVYLRDYILFPTIGLFSLNYLVDRLVRSNRILLPTKEFLSLALFIIFSFYLSLTHDIAKILLSSFILPIFASTIFSEVKITRWTLWMSNIALLIIGSRLFLVGELNSTTLMQLFVAFFMFVCSYLLAKIMIKNGQDHFSALVQSDNQQRFMQQQLQLDPFTGLYNRKTFDADLARLWQEGRKTRKHLALAMFDIDHFKSVNDIFGHAAGDRVLLHFSGILKNIQAENIRAYRMGGDEFAVFFTGCDAQESYHICDEMRKQMKSASLRDSDNHKVTFSCGLACLIPDERGPEMLTDCRRFCFVCC